MATFNNNNNIITHTFTACPNLQTEYGISRPPRFCTPQQSSTKPWAGYGKGTTCVSGGPRRIRASSEYGRCDGPTPKDSAATRSRSRVRCTNTTSGGSERGALVGYSPSALIAVAQRDGVYRMQKSFLFSSKHEVYHCNHGTDALLQQPRCCIACPSIMSVLQCCARFCFDVT